MVLEKVRKKETRFLLFLIFISALLALCINGCVSGSVRNVTISNELPLDLPQDLQDRFEVKEHAPLALASVSPAPSPSPDDSQSSPSKNKKKKKKSKKELKKEKLERERIAALPPPFVYPNRRPEKAPVWLGERLVFSIAYLGVSAGEFSFDVLPYKKMGGRKVYHIRGNAVSSPVFSLFYRLNDFVESFIDFEGIFSHRFHLVLDETKQTRDSLELYDSEKKQTYYWNRWNHKVNGYKETKEFFPIAPFPQDLVSSLYYLRHQTLAPGTVVTFPGVSEGKPFEAICTVERREMMSTPLGKVQTLVIRPEMMVDGVIKKGGDSFLWLTDDERKIPVRLEAKVRVGVVSAVLRKADLGVSPLAEVAAPATENSVPNLEPSSTPSGGPSPEPRG